MKSSLNIQKKIYLFLIFFIANTCFGESQEPRLTLIFIVDQLSQSQMLKLRSHLKGGIKDMLEDAVVYDNAYFPHTVPATSIGHAALSTGVFAKDHGVVGNNWYDTLGKKVNFSEDDSSKSAVFDKVGKLSSYGKSGKDIMVQGFSDYFVLNPKSGSKNYSIAISYKDKASVAVSGQCGKAIWFDFEKGFFTTSKAYFSTLPQWLVDFNNSQKIDQLKTVKWDSAYPLKNKAYDFKHISNYEFAGQKRIVGTKVKVFNSKDKSISYKKFVATPKANKVLLDLADVCINAFTSNKKNNLLLWVSFSSLDFIGHDFGPDSLEAIDYIYHLDKQLKKFIRRLQRRIKKSDIVFVLTSDHGVDPIPEILQQEGVKSAVRINSLDLVKKMNDLVRKKYGIEKLVIGFSVPQFFFDNSKFDMLDAEKKDNIFKDLKAFLTNHSGIKTAWTCQELKKSNFLPTDIESFYKNQLYPGRSGQLIIQVLPHCQVTEYSTGSGHRNPYEYCTHVPLMIYQKGVLERKIVKERVSTLQFANSMAQVLDIPKPSASTFDLLPGLFDYDL